MGDGAEQINCVVRSGDSYCSEHDISSIDFLKLDVEGHELKALQGFRGMLEDHKIQMIQFEHNENAIRERVFLIDILDFLGPIFRVGKIHPSWVQELSYDDKMERFYGANYVAVLASNKRLCATVFGD